MLLEPNCYRRHCKYYRGVKNDSIPFNEAEERNFCAAFPDRIPGEIAYGDNDHSKPLEGQGNDITFEKGPMWWEDGTDQKYEPPPKKLALTL